MSHNLGIKEHVHKRRSNYSHVYGDRTRVKHSSYVPVAHRREQESDAPRQRVSANLPVFRQRKLRSETSNPPSPPTQRGIIQTNGENGVRIVHITVPVQEQTEFMRQNPDYQTQYALANAVQIVAPEPLVKSREEMSLMCKQSLLAYLAKAALARGKAVAEACAPKKKTPRRVSTPRVQQRAQNPRVQQRAQNPRVQQRARNPRVQQRARNPPSGSSRRRH